MGPAPAAESEVGLDAGARARQDWLFPYRNPLRDRLGAEFFRRLPRAPGVYRMLDEAGRTLYIGKAKDLRARVGSYRFVAPGRGSRKVLRLLARVRAVAVEICADERRALLCENRLLREIQPSFNQQKTRPQLYVVAEVRRRDEQRATLCWWRAGDPGPGAAALPAGRRFGVFKGAAGLRRLGASLLRLTAMARGETPAAAWHRAAKDGAELEFPSLPGVDWPRWVEAYLRGDHARLADGLVAAASRRSLDGFAAALLRQDGEILRQFYRHASRRGWLLRRRFGLGRGPIPADLLDDLLVRRARA